MVVINDVQTDRVFRNHPTPVMYGFRSYISTPIVMTDGTIWGTLCAIDPTPRETDKPEILTTFQLFGELIAAQMELARRFEQSQSDLTVSEANLKASETGLLSAEASLRTSQAVGTGRACRDWLGLYIASEIARARGGTLRAASTADQTTFVFEMPQRAS